MGLSRQAPPLAGGVLMDQVWADLVFLHWRAEPGLVDRWMPPGARADRYDGSDWVGLVAFQMRDAGLGRDHPVPYVGTFGEINVRLYSTDDAGRHGVVFCSLETERAAVWAGANLAGVRYRWARVAVDRAPPRIDYRSRRLLPPHAGASTNLAIEVGTEDRSEDPLAVFLTARWGMHTSILGRPLHVPNEHDPWPLQSARLLHCEDDLLAAAGFPGLTDREPDSVLFSPGVRTRFGWPGRYPARPARPCS